MLDMCIRALDYCPAVDITFGEYLRALITADIDCVSEGPRGYRVAFMEAFRKRGMLPRDVRTVSEETLAWSTLDDPIAGMAARACSSDIDFGWNQKLSRSEIFALNEKNRWALWRALNRAFAANPELCAQFGLLPDVPRYKRDGTLVARSREGRVHLRSVRRAAGPPRRARRLVPHRAHRHHPPAPADAAVEVATSAGRRGFMVPRRRHAHHRSAQGAREIRYTIVKMRPAPSGRSGSADGERELPVAAPGALFRRRPTSEPFALLHADEGGDGHG